MSHVTFSKINFRELFLKVATQVHAVGYISFFISQRKENTANRKANMMDEVKNNHEMRAYTEMNRGHKIKRKKTLDTEEF